VNSLKNIAILGSTGSIGRSSLDVISTFPDRFRVTYLTAHRNVDLLAEQIQRFHPKGVVVPDESTARRLRCLVNGTTELLLGEDGLCEAVAREDVDTVVSSLVGFAGLVPTLHAIEAGKDIALANKETLVVAGELVMEKVRERGVKLMPIDSEHSAILQCLQGENAQSVARLILTASGGPFLDIDRESFARITPAQALQHPTWKMGNKITIDSATLMNKGLEVIEAHWLFGLAPDSIDVVIHPQSIIHSMVEFVDGSIKAQLGIPDMKLPIQYALTYPDRPKSLFQRLDFAALRRMTFFAPDMEKFRCLALAFRALRCGGTAPAAMNAANEVAVHEFLNGRIAFSAIPDLIEAALSSHHAVQHPRLPDILRADGETREFVSQQLLTLPPVRENHAVS
jgi:1-deoxy-D-xylulose-5-phosphate reductoisomerase